MVDRVTIGQGLASLVLEDRNPRRESFAAALNLPGISAAVNVYAPDSDGDALARLFATMANNWRGWDGVLTWASAENHLVLKCYCDGFGHVSIEAQMNPEDRNWVARGRILVEAEQLADLAQNIRQFLLEV